MAQQLAKVSFIARQLPRLSRGAMVAWTAGSVVALLAVAWLTRDAGGIVLLGGIVAVLVVAGVRTARAALRPVAALGRAAAPLGLTLLVLVAAGTIESPAIVQLAVGLVTLLVAWYGLIRSDWKSASNPLRTVDLRALASMWRRPRHAAAVGFPVVGFGAILTFTAIPALDALEETGEFSALFFFLAVGLFVVAVVLRLVGYAETRLRALVSVAVGLALARLGIEYGALPGYETFHEELPWLTDELMLVVAGSFVVLVAVAEIATTILLTRDAADGLASGPPRVAAALEAPVLKRSVIGYAAGLGLLASALAALVLVLAVISAATAGGADEQFDELTLMPIDPGQPSRPPGAVVNDEELAEMYSPVLVFTENQRWSPTAVDKYLARAQMTDWEGQMVPAPPVDALPDECPGIAPKPCYELTINCESADDDCAMVNKGKVGEARRDEAVYVRVARRGGEGDGSPNPFASVENYRGERGKLLRSTTILLQYWYFYPYDEWVAPVLAGQLKQRHEADWEAVTIGLDDSGPLFVAYSEHCGGTWSKWADIRVANTAPPRLHPLVAVAEGSQANYRVAEERRAPDWAKCAGVPADTLTLVSYASNIRDRTDSKWSWTPEEHLVVTAKTPPMNFLGRWAPYSRTTLENFRKDQRLGRDGEGPATPTLQRLWQHPIDTIFGGRNWRHE